jgi:hypothetical protein
MAKKKGGKRQLDTKTVFLAVIAGLLLLSLLVFAKHAKLKNNWMKYAGETQKIILESDAKNTEDEAKLLATALGAQVSGKPLYKTTDLQNYVTTVSKELNRDVVVLDTKKVILADTVKANVGKKFMEDNAGQVGETLMDGMTRSFVETSTDYPNGLDQVVVPLKDAGGKIVGAVVLSSETLQ